MSSDYVPCQLTTNSLPSTFPKPFRSQMDDTLSNNHMKPSLARMLAAFEGNKSSNDPSESLIVHMPAAFEDYKLEDDSSSSVTIVASSKATSCSIYSCQSKRASLIILTQLSLPNHESYAQHLHSTLNYTVLKEPPPTETNSLKRQTLATGTPGTIQPCAYPVHTLMAN